MKTYEEIINIIDENQKNHCKFPYNVEKAVTIVQLLKNLFCIQRLTKEILKYEKKYGFSHDAKSKIVNAYENIINIEDNLSELKEQHGKLFKKLIGWYIEKVFSAANDLYVGFTLSTDQEFNNNIKNFAKILNDKRSA